MANNKARQQRQNVSARKKKARDKAASSHGVHIAPWRLNRLLPPDDYQQRMRDIVSGKRMPPPTRQDMEAKERLLCRLFGERPTPYILRNEERL